MRVCIMSCEQLQMYFSEERRMLEIQASKIKSNARMSIWVGVYVCLDMVGK